MKITMTAILERQRARLYTQKAKKLRNFFIYKKLDTFQKARQIPLGFKYKKSYTWHYRIFMKFLKFAFIYKKHDTLRYVTVFYTKIWTLRKKQYNVQYVFIYKNSALLCCGVFHWIFEICGEGGGIYVFKKQCTLCEIFILEKQCTLRYVAIYKDPDTMRYILISKKQYTFLYVYIYIIYRLVLIPNYEPT